MNGAALLRKELRQLLPWTLLVLTLSIGAELLGLALMAPDQFVWAESAPIFSEGGAAGRSYLLCVSALVFAYSGFPREYDDRTLPFLLSLPVSRTHLFLAKAVTAGTVLSGIVIADESVRWFVQLANPTSFDGATFRFGWALASAGTGLASAWVLLGYALFLSLFRRFGLLLGFLATVLVELFADQDPALRRLSPFDLGRLDFEGVDAVVPWLAVLGHLTVSSALAAVAGFIWVGPTERWTGTFSRWTTRPWFKWSFVLGAVAAFGFVLAGVAGHEQQQGEAFGELVELTSPEARLESSRYEFRYPSALRARIEALAAAADPLHDAVTRELGGPAPSNRVVVDLRKSSSTHAGSATWESIRLDLANASDDRALLRTLAHETSHVVALRASDRRMQSLHDALRFFDEGLAEHTALALVRDDAQRDARRFEAALLRSRLRIEFAQLAAFGEFKKRFGDGPVYPLGFVWVEALTEACGADAPRRTLRALAAPDLPRDARGTALWQHVLQATRCDLSQVNAVWGEQLEKTTAAWRVELERVPSIAGGAASVEEEEIVLHAALEGEPLEHAVYRVVLRSPTPDGQDHLQSFSGTRAADGSLRFELGYYDASPTIEYQFVLSWVRQGATVALWSEWQKTQLPAGG